MKDITEFLKGSDYVQKLEQFRKEVNEIEDKYEGDFDLNSPYYTLSTFGKEGVITLVFDKNKGIPLALESSIKNVFQTIWK